MRNMTFKVLTGKVYVSDPCYKTDGDLQLVLDNVRLGKWKMEKSYDGNDVAELTCIAKDAFANSWTKAGEIGVDSGQAGVFESKHYRDDTIADGLRLLSEHSPIASADEGEGSAWYSLCCDKTLAPEYDRGGAIPYGALSSSGIGDGCYDVYICKSGNEIVGIKIVFLEERGSCPRCGDQLDEEDWCPTCDAYPDDEECEICGKILDYDGVCVDKCGEDDEDGDDEYDDEEDYDV